jgi:hypothetical protein
LELDGRLAKARERERTNAPNSGTQNKGVIACPDQGVPVERATKKKEKERMDDVCVCVREKKTPPTASSRYFKSEALSFHGARGFIVISS